METSGGLRYGSAPARRARILELVRETSFLPASRLSELIGVSEMTIRRDIRLLDEQGLVRSVYGGVMHLADGLVPASDATTGTDFRLRASQHQDAKARIAAAALELVRSDTTIALDTGTTAMQLSLRIAPPLRLSVVTPSLPVMVALADRPGIKVIGLGGQLYVESQGFAGPATLAALRSLHVDQLFLSATAIARGALWCGNPWDAETKRELVAIADQVVLLADSAKFSTTAMAHIVPLEEIDVLVTDAGIAAASLAEARAAGVEVVIAGAPGSASRPPAPARATSRARRDPQAVGR